MQASMLFGREYAEKVMFPRFKMAASSSSMEEISSGEKPITSIALCSIGTHHLLLKGPVTNVLPRLAT